jgi:ADP-ribose pyrophosphatase YjhB (NUDIX family)
MNTEQISKSENAKWLDFAIELQSLAQIGLAYGKDAYDLERFQRIRDIAAEMMSIKTGFGLEHVKSVFCNEKGYQTPKIDTRAAIFEDGGILLVQERDGSWSLPGGWCDVNQSIRSNTIKEVREEAGLEVDAVRLIACLDRNKHNTPPYAYGICKAFVLCRKIGGTFAENLETISSGYFKFDDLPRLALAKNTPDQIKMCFDAASAEHWETIFD